MRMVVPGVALLVAGMLLPVRAEASPVQVPATVTYSNDRTALVVTAGTIKQSLVLVQEVGHQTFRGTHATSWDRACTNDVEQDVVRCPTDGVTRIYLRLSPHHDRVVTENQTLRLIVDGGAGDDHLEGSASNDWILGNWGRDRLYGHGGDDLLVGGYGNDLLVGGAGNDDLEGGDGSDTVSYAYMTRPVQVLVCTCRASGDPDAGERDIVRPSVETVHGTAYADFFSGDRFPNRFVGGGGNDLVYGWGGDDVLVVEGGDWFFGGDGTDTASFETSTAGVVAWLDEKPNDGPANANVRADVENLVGSAYRDVLLGSGRANLLHGLGGDDDLVGFGGDDTLVGGAGRDAYSPGAGHDRCVGDAADVNPRDCEVP